MGDRLEALKLHDSRGEIDEDTYTSRFRVRLAAEKEDGGDVDEVIKNWIANQAVADTAKPPQAVRTALVAFMGGQIDKFTGRIEQIKEERARLEQEELEDSRHEG
ncbi:hypothetical protein LTR56_010131 [Elasticomyces elasticus]|nr:hypothetical protein LTR56_010131 [Elasticomyces elasticus]KAK3658877.1 hypothetical protein LTR22_008702 [Elasticomyces elasticus]KAK4923019.1 hypothetical protein LTR49_009681 [Elasticomyces elasticus]KAK5758087.1 hypothetical protein LTS12_011847 [Elasticomyces elasticus]